EDGRLMLNCRYNRAGVRVVMTTSDMGETWQPHPTNVKTLIEPGACQASLIDVTRELDLIKPNRDRSNERPLLLFCNPNSPRGRKNMTIKASLDGGETWPVEYQVLLDGEMSGGYSCMSMIDENTVGILYEGSQAHMTFQRIKIIDILGR
ncbi:MAG: exo-alpha-sialidase, partial [Planctomycetaceae bacterium]|nr:exo-alpha-sialidase [Planctomycetaceae bacterium]